MTIKEDFRSHCAVNYGMEIFGDKWSLLIIRDIVFAGNQRRSEGIGPQWWLPFSRGQINALGAVRTTLRQTA